MTEQKKKLLKAKIAAALYHENGKVPSPEEIEGFRLGRDNWVSVRYAGELNSGKSSVLLQRADRHGILGQKPPDFQVSL